MRLGAIFLVLLFAGFLWFLWHGIDLATSWLEQARAPAPYGLELDEAEFTATDPGPALLPRTPGVEETAGTMPARESEAAGTTSPVEPAQDLMAEAPIGAVTTRTGPSESPVPDAAEAAPEVLAAPEPAMEPLATEPPTIPASTDEPVPTIQAEALQCDVERCAEAFRSFRTSDCTYQPFEGPRRLCPFEVGGAEPAAASTAAPPAQAEPPQCNIERCADAFRSFRTSDCTYQPFEGPRQLCSL